MRILDGRRLLTIAACCAPLIYVACSTFTAEEASTSGADSSAPTPDESGADALRDANAVTNIGCPGHTTVVDFTRAVELGGFFPSRDGGLTVSSDDAGTFGRVQVALTTTTNSVKFTYSAPLPQTKFRSVCFSAKIRTPAAPSKSDLSVFGLFRRDQANPNVYGYASLLLGSQQNLLVAYTPSDGGSIVTGGNARIKLAESAFRLVRLDAHATDGGGPWSATMALDGAPQVFDAPMSSPQTQTGSLELWFGMDVGQAGSETVAVDFADVRVDLD